MVAQFRSALKIEKFIYFRILAENDLFMHVLILPDRFQNWFSAWKYRFEMPRCCKIINAVATINEPLMMAIVACCLKTRSLM